MRLEIIIGINDENLKDKLPRGHKCHECGGVGHICADYGNLINSKGRPLMWLKVMSQTMRKKLKV
jgi:hypothetical protein